MLMLCVKKKTNITLHLPQAPQRRQTPTRYTPLTLILLPWTGWASY